VTITTSGARWAGSNRLSGDSSAAERSSGSQVALSSRESQESYAAAWPFLADRPPVVLDWLPWNHTFGGNSDFNITGAERNVVNAQFARFAAKCRLFAPMYRQVTLPALRAMIAGKPIPVDRELGYNDVLAAWNYYLEHDNKGRGFVLVGHSHIALVLASDGLFEGPDRFDVSYGFERPRAVLEGAGLWRRPAEATRMPSPQSGGHAMPGWCAISE
jgi:hypothetical protein